MNVFLSWPYILAIVAANEKNKIRAKKKNEREMSKEIVQCAAYMPKKEVTAKRYLFLFRGLLCALCVLLQIWLHFENNTGN